MRTYLIRRFNLISSFWMRRAAQLSFACLLFCFWKLFVIPGRFVSHDFGEKHWITLVIYLQISTTLHMNILLIQSEKSQCKIFATTLLSPKSGPKIFWMVLQVIRLCSQVHPFACWSILQVKTGILKIRYCLGRNNEELVVWGEKTQFLYMGKQNTMVVWRKKQLLSVGDIETSCYK